MRSAEALKSVLLACVEEDTAVRSRLAESGALFQGYHPEMEAIHRKNAQALRAILAEIPWPSKSLVGPEAAQAAWVIAMHAIGEPDFMRDCLARLRSSDCPPAWAPIMEDRIRFYEGKPQRYGTNSDWDEAGELSPTPLEDPAQADALRASVGLEPLAQSTPNQRAAAKAHGESAPAPFAERQAEMKAWFKKVGWQV